MARITGPSLLRLVRKEDGGYPFPRLTPEQTRGFVFTKLTPALLQLARPLAPICNRIILRPKDRIAVPEQLLKDFLSDLTNTTTIIAYFRDPEKKSSLQRDPTLQTLEQGVKAIARLLDQGAGVFATLDGGHSQVREDAVAYINLILTVKPPGVGLHNWFTVHKPSLLVVTIEIPELRGAVYFKA